VVNVNEKILLPDNYCTSNTPNSGVTEALATKAAQAAFVINSNPKTVHHPSGIPLLASRRSSFLS
jgi:hypothetical protein